MKIILVCNAGMSTGIMQVRLQDCAKKDGVDAEITAMPISEIDTYDEDVDIVLLGPQIRFAEDDLKKTFANRAYVYCIDLQDFGLMRAENVWNKIKDKCK